MDDVRQTLGMYVWLVGYALLVDSCASTHAGTRE